MSYTPLPGQTKPKSTVYEYAGDAPVNQKNTPQNSTSKPYQYKTMSWGDGMDFLKNIHGDITGTTANDSGAWGNRNFINFADGAKFGYGDSEYGKNLQEFNLLNYAGANRAGGGYSAAELQKMGYSAPAGS